jgi:lysozyme
MADPVRAAPPKRGLAAIVGVVAAAALLAFTPTQEGTVLKTYADIGGVLSYCTGATENAQWGKNYTPAECKAQLDRDLARHAEGVMACVHVPMTDGQKTAHVDAAFNIGVNAWCGSSMARKTNAGDAVGGCNALLLWNRVSGREIAGLTKRRKLERDICLKGIE